MCFTKGCFQNDPCKRCLEKNALQKLSCTRCLAKRCLAKVCFAKGKLQSMSALYDDPLFSDLTNSQTETITENRKRGKSRDGSCSRPHKLKTKKMSKSTKQKKVEKERSERSKKLEGSKNKKLKLNAMLIEAFLVFLPLIWSDK